MRDAGLKPVSVNCRIRAINSYLKWSGSALKVPKLKVENRALPTFSVDDIGKIAKWKPSTWTQRRLQVLILMLADIAEVRAFAAEHPIA
jgi:hypothetical protein